MPTRRMVDIAALSAPHPIAGVTFGAVSREGARHVQLAGFAQREPVAVGLTRATWFDVASLTKVVFTTTAILRLVAARRIALDEPLAVAVPDLRQYDVAGAPERRLTYRQCLAHATHLPAVEPLYTYGQDPATLRAFILQRAWRAGPPVYSDINFMLLGIALERLVGPLDAHPLPEGLTFRPDPALSAATERCAWRGRVLRGEVHDENAAALGGAAGHAGLFGTVDGVLDFARGLLDGTALPTEAMAAIRTRHADTTRTLGWQLRHDGWSGGMACSPDTIGHTGFTGTGLWIDFARGFAWTLLSNRVHPTRHRETGIAALRQEVGNAAVSAWDGAGGAPWWPG